jgi:hypothetical protein
MGDKISPAALQENIRLCCLNYLLLILLTRRLQALDHLIRLASKLKM